jgi:HK97 family phage portal protein
MSFAAQIITAPFAAVGATLRMTSSMLFARGRGWALWIRRTVIDYQAEVGDPLSNSIVGAVVGWIARNFPEAPVRIIREDDPDATPIVRAKTGPGAMLRLLEKPNAYYSGVLQWIATIVDFVVDGNAYWVKIRNDSKRVVELWWIPARLLEPRWDENDPSDYVSWYAYAVDGKTYRIEARDVVHFRNGLDPTNPRKGRSPMASLFREIFTDEEAAAFTASLLRNLGVPGVVISPANTTGGKAMETKAETVKQKFMDRFSGDSRGEPLVLSAPTDVKVLSWNPQQMDLKALRRIPEERVSAVTGVPAGVAGLGAGLDRNTFTNYAEANVAAYTQGVIPLHRLIAAELEIQLLPEFVSDAIELYDVIFDASSTAAMRGVLVEIWKLASQDAKSGLMTRADYKRLTGRKVAADGSDNVFILPNNYVVVEAGGNSPRLLLGAPKGDTPPTAPPGAVVTVPDRPLLASGPVRCSGTKTMPDGSSAPCLRILALEATAPYRFECPRCKAETSSPIEEVAA